MSVNPIPAGYHTITPYFVVSDAPRFIAFLKAAFSAVEVSCNIHNDKIAHAEFKIGDSMIMLGEANSGQPVRSSSLYVYVPDTDKVYNNAMQAGAKSLMEPADQFYGDRNAGIEDVEGNTWWIATHFEDVSDAEMEQRIAKYKK